MKNHKQEIANRNKAAIDMLRETFGRRETLALSDCEKLLNILDRAETDLPKDEAVAMFEALIEADIKFVSAIARNRLRSLCPPIKRPTSNESAFQKLVTDRADAWLPACGGTETPFKSRSGKTLLYCYNPHLRKHAYLDCDSDIILTDEEAAKALELF